MSILRLNGDRFGRLSALLLCIGMGLSGSHAFATDEACEAVMAAAQKAAKDLRVEVFTQELAPEKAGETPYMIPQAGGISPNEWGRIEYDLLTPEVEAQAPTRLTIRFLRENGNKFTPPADGSENRLGTAKKRFSIKTNVVREVWRRIGNAETIFWTLGSGAVNFFTAILTYDGPRQGFGSIPPPLAGEVAVASSIGIYAATMAWRTFHGDSNTRSLRNALRSGDSLSERRFMKILGLKRPGKAEKNEKPLDVTVVVLIPRNTSEEGMKEYAENFEEALSDLVSEGRLNIRSRAIP